MEPPRILIVDDEEKNIKLLKAILAYEGYTILTADNGESALQSAFEAIPDLIILDVMMPGLNGFEVCRGLKADPRTQIIPVLMVTALKDKEDREKAFQEGADDFLTKPIESFELIMRVKSLLRIKHYYDELTSKNTELHDKHKRLEEMEKVKESLYHMIVHDLRSPLMSIVGSLQLINSDPDLVYDNQQDLVELCLQGCQDITQLIDNLLEIQRLENTNLTIRRERFDWKSLMEKLEQNFLVKAKLKDIMINFSADMEQTEIFGDMGIMIRVMSNLLDNAIRHTPEEGNISILSKTNAQNNTLTVFIKDSGDGIPKAYHEKIFDRFEQLSNGEDNFNRVGSSGLGLAFCKLALDAHGGRIWVESEGKGTGAKFCFELPLPKA